MQRPGTLQLLPSAGERSAHVELALEAAIERGHGVAQRRRDPLLEGLAHLAREGLLANAKADARLDAERAPRRRARIDRIDAAVHAQTAFRVQSHASRHDHRRALRLRARAPALIAIELEPAVLVPGQRALDRAAHIGPVA